MQRTFAAPLKDAEAMAILALDHLQLAMPVGREDEARAFYGDLLGFAEQAKGWAGDNESGGPWDSVQMGFNGRRIFGKLAFNF